MRPRTGGRGYRESISGYARVFVRSLRSLRKPGYPGMLRMQQQDNRIEYWLRQGLGSLAALAAEAKIPALLRSAASIYWYCNWLRQGIRSLATLAAEARLPRQRKRCNRYNCIEYWLRQGLGSLATLAAEARLPHATRVTATNTNIPETCQIYRTYGRPITSLGKTC